MISAPWYLLSAGIVVLLIGSFMAALSKQERPPPIDPRLTDEEIAEALQARPGGGWASLVILLGGAMVFVSVAWRLLRLLF